MSVGVAFESVLDAAKAGATWAWLALYREISGPVTGFFRSRGAADPESAAGDVFFELSRDLRTFAGDEAAFETLVFTIAYRRLLVDDRHPRPNPRSALADRALDHPGTDIEVVVNDTEPKIAPGVKAGMERMLPEERDVFSLRMVAGLTAEQTADVVGTTVEMIRATERKGLTRLAGPTPPPVTLR